MPNFGIPPRASASERREQAPLNWQRGLFRVWLLLSVGWIMGWTIYLIMDGIQGGFQHARRLDQRANRALRTSRCTVDFWVGRGLGSAWD